MYIRTLYSCAQYTAVHAALNGPAETDGKLRYTCDENLKIGSDYATCTGRGVYIRRKSMPEQENILLYDSGSASKQIDRIRRIVLLEPRRQTGMYNRNRGKRSYYIRNERNFSPQLGPSFNCRPGRPSAIGTRFSGRFLPETVQDNFGKADISSVWTPSSLYERYLLYAVHNAARGRAIRLGGIPQVWALYDIV